VAGAIVAQINLRSAVALALGITLTAPLSAQAEWRVRRPSFDPRAIGYYKKLLTRNPHDTHALSRLFQLYRRHGRVGRLLADYGAQVARHPGRLAPRLVLAHLLRLAEETAKALAAYEAAAVMAPRDGRIFGHLGALHERCGHGPAAEQAYTRALALERSPKRRIQLLRRLSTLAERRKSWRDAARHLRQLADLRPRDFQTQMKLATAQQRAGMLEEAIATQREATRLARSTARRIDSLKRLARIQRRTRNHADALATYQRLLKLTAKDHWSRRETLLELLELYRERDELGLLLQRWQQRWKRRGHLEWTLLAHLHAETGDIASAVRAYRAALKRAPRDIDIHLRLITLLDGQGNHAEALRAYESLARVHPRDPQHLLELARRLRRAGQHERARRTLQRCVTRFARDTEVRAAAADIWLRWGEEKQALREARALFRLAPRQESHILRLAEHYYLSGQKRAARRIWKRLLALIPERHRALARLASVYAQHDMESEAIELYRQAIALAPQTFQYRRDLAFLLENERQHAAALSQWKQLHVEAHTRGDRRLARECRRHIVDLLARTGGLFRAMRRYRERLSRAPADLVAGLLLAEAYERRHDRREAIRVLERVVDLAPDQIAATEQLERLCRLEHRLPRAVELLQRLARINPEAAGRYYQKIAELKLQLLDDDKALEYARRAARAANSDPSGYARLGELLTLQQDYPAAVRAFEQALVLAPDRDLTRFQLAELHARQGEHLRALELYRLILKQTSRPSLARRTFRAALPLSTLVGQREQLERIILDRCRGASRNLTNVYRGLLLRYYQRHIPELSRQQIAARSAAKRAAAGERLARLRRRATAPLLTILAAETASQQQRQLVAQLLGQLGAQHAAGALLRLAADAPTESHPPTRADRAGPRKGRESYREYAHRSAARDLRRAALHALGQIAHPSTGPTLASLVRAGDGSMRELVLWALGRVGGKAGISALRQALNDARPGAQLFACVGVGAHGNPTDRQRVRAVLSDLSRDVRVRAACAWAAGALRDQTAYDALAQAAASGARHLARCATLALGQLRDPRSVSLLLRLSFADQPRVREAAIGALVRLETSIDARERSIRGRAPVVSVPLITLSSGPIDQRDFLAALQYGWNTVPAVAKLRVIERYGAAMAHTLETLLDGDPVAQLRVLRHLECNGDRLLIAAWTDEHSRLTKAQQRRLGRALRRLSNRLVAPLSRITRSSDPLLVQQASHLLGQIGSPSARAALRRFLEQPDTSPSVQARALRALRRAVASKQVGRVERGALRDVAVARLAPAHCWQVREAAVLLLGQIISESEASCFRRAVLDPSPFVRQAVVTVLSSLGGSERNALLEALERDTVPQVRNAAARVLGRR
jgi:tetratricopeptide (TPR) repeat protein/HEAT repeat protein